MWDLQKPATTERKIYLGHPLLDVAIFKFILNKIKKNACFVRSAITICNALTSLGFNEHSFADRRNRQIPASAVNPRVFSS